MAAESAVLTVTVEVEHARSAGLRYVDDRSPGLRRERTQAGFAYFDSRGKAITDEAELARIRSLAIPPAYEHVWICPYAHGHVQATARDAKGRKQYRYHKRWREVRDANKYESTVAFAKALPRLRERVEADFSRPEMSRDNVIATVVRMLETTLVRVGNESYARDNQSYGLTTLRARHVKVEGQRRVRLRFRGKSGVEHSLTIEDRRLARAVARCRDLPGEVLFTYLDDAGEAQPIVSDDVNAYLREVTAATFRRRIFGRGPQPSHARPNSKRPAHLKRKRRRSRPWSPLSSRPRSGWATRPPSVARHTCIRPSSSAISTNCASTCRSYVPRANQAASRAMNVACWRSWKRRRCATKALRGCASSSVRWMQRGRSVARPADAAGWTHRAGE